MSNISQKYINCMPTNAPTITCKTSNWPKNIQFLAINFSERHHFSCDQSRQVVTCCHFGHWIELSNISSTDDRLVITQSCLMTMWVINRSFLRTKWVVTLSLLMTQWVVTWSFLMTKTVVMRSHHVVTCWKSCHQCSLPNPLNHPLTTQS